MSPVGHPWRGRRAAALSLGLTCASASTSACSPPDLLHVTLVGGAAEAVTEIAGVRVVGSFDLELALPPSGDTTDFLLRSMAGWYDHGPSCPSPAATLQLSSAQTFPLQLEPGTTITVTIDFEDPDAALASTCAPVQQLDLSGTYYDSVRDGEEGDVSTAVTGSLPVAPGTTATLNDWTCVGQLDPPTFAPGTSVGTIWVRERSSGNVVPGSTVRTCAQQDLECDSPFDEGVTDIVGYWPLLAPTSEPFFFDVDGSPAIVPALFYEYAPPGKPKFARTLHALSPKALTDAASALGTSVAQGRGHLIVGARDCQGEPAAGVRIAVAPSQGAATLGYWQDGGVAPELTETGSDGLAVVLNAAPGVTSVMARLAASDEGIATRLVNVRAGTTTVVSVEPWPQGP